MKSSEFYKNVPSPIQIKLFESCVCECSVNTNNSNKGYNNEWSYSIIIELNAVLMMEYK